MYTLKEKMSPNRLWMTQNLGHESNQHGFRNFTDMKGMLRMIAEKILGTASPDRSRRMLVYRKVISGGGETHTHKEILTQNYTGV